MHLHFGVYRQAAGVFLCVEKGRFYAAAVLLLNVRVKKMKKVSKNFPILERRGVLVVKGGEN